jgi:diguanylate cyclase (GGDEF)-like protein
LRQLSTSKDEPFGAIWGILKDTCDFFGLYSGFVYEADDNRIFRLHEQYLCQNEGSKNQFILSDYFNDEDVEELGKHPGDIIYLNSQETQFGAKFLDFFSAKTLMIVPVSFEQKKPIAFVGLMDRRNTVRLDKQLLDDAGAVLSVLAAHIKLRAYQKQLEYTMEHDTLTGLPNRQKFTTDIHKSIERMRQNGSSGYLLFMDLDDFHDINKTIGHVQADKLLCDIGEFLYSNREILGMPYRIGGDEFVILAENTSPAALDKIRDLLLRSFTAKRGPEGPAVICNSSIGAVAIPQGEVPVDELIEAADDAMYEVKESGKGGFRVFDKILDK